MTEKLTQGTSLQPGGKIKVGGNKVKTVQERLLENAAKPPTVVRRKVKESDYLSILSDASGSMGGIKLEHLKLALEKLSENINFNITPVAMDSFPGGSPHVVRLQQAAKAYIEDLVAGGSTPMASAMDRIMPMTARVILISDGQPDSEDAVLERAHAWATRKIICDCLHIGAGKDGELLLKQVAEITGGMYFKFTDPIAFSQALHHLAPKNRASLESKSKEEIAGLLGAAEVIK